MMDNWDDLLKSIKEDSSVIDTLSDEKIVELSKKLNPYNVKLGDDKYTCLSVIDLDMKYKRRFLMTSLIGFLFKQCEEYRLDDCEAPNGDIKTYKKDYELAKQWLSANPEPPADSEKLIKYKGDKLKALKCVEYYSNILKRHTVKEFLDSIFKFNPDEHVTNSYGFNPLDPSRNKLATESSEECSKKCCDKDCKKECKDSCQCEVKEGKKMLVDETKDPADVEDKTLTSADNVPSVDGNGNVVAAVNAPPKDTYHYWEHYTDTNYEKIMDVVNNMYSEKPDLHFAIQPHATFSSQEEAETYMKKHRNLVITDMLMLTNGKWSLTGAFSENVERINFYNQNTSIIEEILKQNESDKKVGAELMKNRVKRKRRKNKKDHGTIPKEFLELKKQNPSKAELMGAERIKVDDEKKETLQLTGPEGAVVEEVECDEKIKDLESSLFKLSDEIPEDGIQVDIIEVNQGGKNTHRSEFFTKAVDPEVNI